MVELSRREKEAGILPDPNIDTYMKVILASTYIFHFILVNNKP